MIAAELLTATDFVAVRAALVAELGRDANRALVLTRIHFRADARWREAHEANGVWYWRATRETIADETGLSVDQVKRILAWLIENEYVESVDFQLEGAWDRTRSLRVLTTVGADPRDGRAESPDVGADLHRSIGAESPNPPLTEVKTLSVPGAWEAFWAAYPNKSYVNNAKTAFDVAIATGLDANMLIAAAAEYAASVAGSEIRFIKQASKWLGEGGWSAYQQARVTPMVRPQLTPEERRAKADREMAEMDERALEATRQAYIERTGKIPEE